MVIASESEERVSSPMEAVKVLIVEDDALVVLLLTELLVDMGHEVCGTAATEVDAAAGALHHRPTLMIVDAKLAAGSGFSLIEELHRRKEPAAYFFLSGDPARVRSRFPEAVVVGKPFRRRELAAAIDAAIAATRAAT